MVLADLAKKVVYTSYVLNVLLGDLDEFVLNKEKALEIKPSQPIFHLPRPLIPYTNEKNSLTTQLSTKYLNRDPIF